MLVQWNGRRSLDKLNRWHGKQVFLDKNEESLSYPDILLLKGKLLYLYLDEDRGLKLLGDMKEDFLYRKDIISEVEGVLDAR